MFPIRCGFVFYAAVLSIAAPAFAQAPAVPHVRAHAEVAALVADAARQSPTIQGLIDQLQTLDVTVYVRRQRFPQSELEGRTGLLSTVGTHRYLVIELACGRAQVSEMATLGHELFHAVEIASDPSIVDRRALAAFYTRIGFQTDNSTGGQAFETNGASRVGRQVRRELFAALRDTTAPR
jgi:hypothetical protein